MNKGGIVIVFDQQYGYEFSALPVPQEFDGSYKKVNGYGWEEDQACFTNAAYLNVYHQMFSGQTQTTPSLNIDGYFTSYPSSSIVLLNKVSNGQPAMLMYDYGLGKVIVTTMYSDFAFGHGAISYDEIHLIRDLIYWAKKPAQLPEVRCGESITVMVTIKNNTAVDANTVKLEVYDPDRAILILHQTVEIAVPAEQSVTIPFSFTTPKSDFLPE